MGTVHAKSPESSDGTQPIDLKHLKAKVQRVHVDGLSKTKEDIVINSLRRVFDASDFHDVIFKVHEARMKLEKLNCFGEVGVFIDTYDGPDAVDDAIQVTFEVREARALQASVSTNVGNNEGNIATGGAWRNTFGRGEEFKGEYSYGNKKTSAFSACFTKPLHNSVDAILTLMAYQQSSEFPWSSLSELDRGVLFGLAFTALQNVALLFGSVHILHVSTLFENEKQFSHLSNVEREIIFSSEMGFYYSYYKTIVEADTFLIGLNRLVYDNVTEFGSKINALQRFNVYPELMMGATFRLFDAITTFLGIDTRTCWLVSRGEDLSSVVSCRGLGDPIHWYLAGVWLSAGLSASLLFLHGTQLSGSLAGGLITAFCFLFNHQQATRVHSSPPLRETFAFPCSVAISIVVMQMLRSPKASWSRVLLLGFVSLCYLLCWQVSQLTLVIVVVTVYMMYAGQVVRPLSMVLVFLGTICGFLNHLVLQFGNPTQLTSPLAACLLGLTLLYFFLEPLINHLPSPFNKGMQVSLIAIATMAARIEMTNLVGRPDESHLYNVLKSKFSNYTDLTVRLSLCSPDYGSLGGIYLQKLGLTLLVPVAALVGGAVFVHTMISFRSNLLKEAVVTTAKDTNHGSSNKDAASKNSSNIDNCNKNCDSKDSHSSSTSTTSESFIWEGVDPGMVFNFSLLLAYATMASLVAQFQFLLTPQLCVIASLLSCRKYFPIIHQREVHWALLCLIMCGMCVQGFTNISNQHAMVPGEGGAGGDVETERLIDWVNAHTSDEAVFAGSAHTMATLALTTRRSLANHPHWESVRARERTLSAYSVFSRRSAESVYQTLMTLRVNYVVLDAIQCLAQPGILSKTSLQSGLLGSKGCRVLDIWDMDEPKLRHKAPLCPQLFLQETTLPFQRVYNSSRYAVLQVPSQYVQIPPLKQQSA